MTLDSRWYEADSRFIAGHYQPATLIDLALSRDIDSHRLLRGTGLFYDDIVAGHTRLSPQQCFALIANDGVVEQLFVEAPGKFEVSDAQSLLAAL